MFIVDRWLCADCGGNMRMARTGYLHFALGIEQVGIGGYSISE